MADYLTVHGKGRNLELCSEISYLIPFVEGGGDSRG